MKLTVEDVMGEESGVKVKRTKASKEKPQKKWGRKDKDDDIYNEDDMLVDEDTSETDDAELEIEDSDGVVESETDDEAGDEEPSKKFAGLRLAVLILAALFGLGLILFGIRGVIGRMQLDQTIETPTDDYDSSYDEVLDAPEESFDDVNAGREETTDPNAVPEGEGAPEGDPNAAPDPNADTTMSTAEEPSGIAVETPEHKTSLEEEIALLKAEISRLNEVVASAQNNEAMKDQELNNAKAMLEASTAREAELQRQLDALSTNNTNE